MIKNDVALALLDGSLWFAAVLLTVTLAALLSMDLPELRAPNQDSREGTP